MCVYNIYIYSYYSLGKPWKINTCNLYLDKIILAEEGTKKSRMDLLVQIRGCMVSIGNNQAEDGIDGHTVTKEDRQFNTVL